MAGVSGATFTFVNKCRYTVWPGILGQPGRTGCNFNGSSPTSYATADCGTGQIECNGAGATPPATIAEFTLGSSTMTQNFYDVSLVDGYNIQMIVEVNSGSGDCATTGCVDDLNQRCPPELRVAGGAGCRSACEAFGTAEYFCKGEFGSPQSCQPTAYS
ncbi:Thaumatin [Artemisia annua]|uniref:Thaumatin n=1 Tax=Artemisia annua TaxID=35608 RepID=A0A2U1P639_ARTAN|nr:Thaumatin [Artemisia annua]